MRKSDVVAMLLVTVIIVSCCMGIRATERDNECTKIGGHIEGMFEMRCVVP